MTEGVEKGGGWVPETSLVLDEVGRKLDLLISAQTRVLYEEKPMTTFDEMDRFVRANAHQVSVVVLEMVEAALKTITTTNSVATARQVETLLPLRIKQELDRHFAPPSTGTSNESEGK